MSSGKSRPHVWRCPRCGATTTLFVRATEVVCKNKDAHTSTPVSMELVESRRAAKA